MEDGDRDFLIAAIVKAIEECKHIDTLDLVYKILIADDIQ